jgi:hypothetical protein
MNNWAAIGIAASLVLHVLAGLWVSVDWEGER